MTETRSYSAKTTKNLMLLSGGRCELCTEQLIFFKDENTVSNIAQIAHINGLNPGSKRYDKNIKSSMRNQQANLMVLCPNCHKKIDDDSDYYTIDYLKKTKLNFERNSVKEVMALTNKTNLGSFTDFKTGTKFLNFLFEDAPDDIKKLKPSSLNCQLDNLEDEEAFIIDLIFRLKDLNPDSRSALLKISEGYYDDKNNAFSLKYSYWEGAYGTLLREILLPLHDGYFIDIDAWIEDGLFDEKLKITESWKFILRFLYTNSTDFDKLIMDRNLEVLD